MSCTLGAHLPSSRAARDRAIEGARRIIGDAVREGRLPLDYQFEIADETRETVLVVSFMEAVDLQSVHAITQADCGTGSGNPAFLPWDPAKKGPLATLQRAKFSLEETPDCWRSRTQASLPVGLSSNHVLCRLESKRCPLQAVHHGGAAPSSDPIAALE